jgi:hypothetical protein
VFDETKVSKKNLPEAKSEPTGYEKAKAIASNLPGAKRPTTRQIEDTPTIQQGDDVSVEDSPF